MKPILHLLTGPTCVGKTELALRWAEAFDAEIVSCDALLFYRGMDIGTAKPTVAERSRVPHHLIDILEPDESMDIRRYVSLAQETVDEIRRRGRRVLVTGGSGFYLSAFLRPVADRIEISDAVEQRVEVLWQTAGLDGMVEALREADPECIGSLDVNNPRRVVRALERCWQTGRSLAELRSEMTDQPFLFAGEETRIVRLTRSRETLAERIAVRVQAMLTEGLVDEVRALQERGLERNPSAAAAIGYRETLAWLRAGESDLDKLAEVIATDTRRLVRKQETWFRHQLPTHRVIDLDVETASVEDLFAF